MATLTAILSAIPALLKLLGFFVDMISKTDGEKRRESLADLDRAIDLAKEKNDLTELSKWLGKRL
jgi:hypothetical protein